jgi:aldose 1-epimerase
MVCASLTAGERELLDRRRGLEAYRERGKTMGIPLLYPWANRLERREFEVAGRTVSLPEPGTTIGIDEHGLPIHGAQPRLMRWHERDGPAIDAVLDWRAPELLAIFPFAHSANYRATLGPGPALTVELTVNADAGDPVPVAFGLHPYLRLPSSARERCHLELPACDRLDADDQGIPTGAREPLGPATANLDRGWDDGLVLGETPATFTAVGEAGRVSVELLDGFTHGQVFSPPDAEFVCFEPMTAPANALISGDGLRVLEPGQQLRTSFRIAWEEA